MKANPNFFAQKANSNAGEITILAPKNKPQHDTAHN
jgi:hypothetical protein